MTINLSRIGIEANHDIDKFWEILESRTNLCIETLHCRHDILKGTKAKVAPELWMYGAIARLDAEDVIDPLLYHPYSTISVGYVGGHEMCMALLGKSITSKEGEKLMLDVVKYLRKRCDEEKEKTGIGFSLYATPAESLVHKFSASNRSHFGIIEGVTDKEYITNSFHVNVCEEIDAFSKLRFESQFPLYSSGGNISYIETPFMQNNLKALESIVKYGNEHAVYFELNTKLDTCFECGFKGEMMITDELTWECPSCGNTNKSKMQTLRRTCGYLGDNDFNKGKTQELKERVVHLN